MGKTKLSRGDRIECIDNKDWGEWFMVREYSHGPIIYEIARCYKPSDQRILSGSEFDEFWKVV